MTIALIPTVSGFLLHNSLFMLYGASVIVDIVLGNTRAWTAGDVDSAVGLKGTLKHLAVFTFVVLFLPVLAMYLEASAVSTAVLSYLTYQYAISIIENLDALGFKMPSFLEDSFRRLNKQNIDDDDEGGK